MSQVFLGIIALAVIVGVILIAMFSKKIEKFLGPDIMELIGKLEDEFRDDPAAQRVIGVIKQVGLDFAAKKITKEEAWEVIKKEITTTLDGTVVSSKVVGIVFGWLAEHHLLG